MLRAPRSPENQYSFISTHTNTSSQGLSRNTSRHTHTHTQSQRHNDVRKYICGENRTGHPPPSAALQCMKLCDDLYNCCCVSPGANPYSFGGEREREKFGLTGRIQRIKERVKKGKKREERKARNVYSVWTVYEAKHNNGRRIGQGNARGRTGREAHAPVVQESPPLTIANRAFRTIDWRPRKKSPILFAPPVRICLSPRYIIPGFMYSSMRTHRLCESSWPRSSVLLLLHTDASPVLRRFIVDTFSSSITPIVQQLFNNCSTIVQ